MKILVVDDEKILLRKMLRMLGEIVPDAQIDSFSDSSECLLKIRGKSYDIVFTDVRMPEVTGFDIAAEAKNTNPMVNIIFTTGYGEYIEDAMWVHASGFLEKPISPEDLKSSLNNLLYPLKKTESTNKIRIVTFGNFMIFNDGEPVIFGRSKSKEALAFIVDRRTGCTKKEIAAALFEDQPYDRSTQKYLSNILLDLAQALKKSGAEEVLLHKTNYYSINEEIVSCDLYDVLDRKTEKNVSGEYMAQYAWAEGRFSGL